MLAVGRCVAKKAPLTTLEAFRRAAPRPSRACGWRTSATGRCMDELRAARRRPAGRPARSAAARAGAGAVIAAADVFCQHSVRDPETGDEEGLPIAILEAMAHGLPVVATRHAGIPDAVVDGETGFLVDERDVSAMAERLERLARDPALRRAMGAAGRRRAESRFSWAAERAGLAPMLGL